MLKTTANSSAIASNGLLALIAKSPRTSMTSIPRTSTTWLSMLLLATLVACGGGGGGGGGGTSDPVDTFSPEVSNFNLIPDTTGMSLSWTNPERDDLASIRITWTAYLNAARNPAGDGSLLIDSSINNGAGISSGTSQDFRITMGERVINGTAISGAPLNAASAYVFALQLSFTDPVTTPPPPPQLPAVPEPQMPRILGPNANGNSFANRQDPVFANDKDADTYSDDVDVDDDGDGLIEIRTAAQLNMIRYNLQGTAFDTDNSDNNNNSGGDTTGCGGIDARGNNITDCNGYELAGDIDLAGYSSWIPLGTCGTGRACDTSTAAQMFTAIFAGNDYTISNLNINRTEGSYGVGLFSAIAAGSELRNLHVVGGSINALTSGNSSSDYATSDHVGGLVGYGRSATIISSSATLRSISGNYSVGGLIGDGTFSTISLSEVNLGAIRGDYNVGGLIGDANGTTATSSVATVGEITGIECVGGLAGYAPESVISASTARVGGLDGTSSVGGLVGTGQGAAISASTARVGELSGDNTLGGLLGNGKDAVITSSYVSADTLNGTLNVGGLSGFSDADLAPSSVVASYWDARLVFADAAAFVPAADSPLSNLTGSSQTTLSLQNKTDFTGIYTAWTAAYCDAATGTYQNISAAGFSPAWDLGNEVQYPALNCLPLTLAQQRALAIDSLRTDNDNDGTRDYFDTDDDNDLVLDISDNCPLIANPQQNNSDTDALGDACDTDDDNDLVLDISDNCQFVMNFPQYNNDTDALGDACDPDDDNDLVLDFNDNCQFVMNFLQYNNDTDALGDACDADDDNDLVLDFTSDGSVLDNCQFVMNFPQYNNDTDALGDACDTDDDNDLVLDISDNCQFVANSEQYNNDTDALGDACDADDDNDLVLDFTSDGSVLDNCQFVPNNDQADNDNDLLGDACDPDDDDDMILDFTSDGSILDNCQFVPNNDQADSDGDLIGDACSDPDQDGISDGDDVDADGDGLIEIHTVAELNMIRHNLQGTGLDADNSDNNNSIGGVTTGCGGIDSFGNRVAACNGYELTQDITLSGFWEPIGGDCVNLRGHVNIGPRLIADTNCINATSPQVFSGVFDGNGYSIDGMRINLAGFTQNIYGHGLFAGTQGAVIRNLRLLNVDATNEPRLDTAFSGGFVGGLVGYALDTTIINSSVHGNIGSPLSALEGGPSGAVHGAERSVDYAGGLVGSADQLQILGSYFNGSVVAETAASGLVATGRDVTIRHSAAFGPTIAAGIYNSFIITTSSGTLEIAGVYSDFDYSNIAQIRGGGHTMVGFLAGRTSVVASYVKGTISTLGGGLDGLVFSALNIGDIVDKIEINASYVYDNLLGRPSGTGTPGEYTEFTHPIYSTGLTPEQVSLSAVYWDYDTNRIARSTQSFDFHVRFDNASLNSHRSAPTAGDGARGLAYPSGVLTNTNSFSGIYEEWGKYWCHPETYDFLRSDNVPAAGYIRAWDLGGPGDYPALNCHPISLAEQRSRSGRLRQHVPADPALAIRVVNPAGTGLDTVLAAPGL